MPRRPGPPPLPDNAVKCRNFWLGWGLRAREVGLYRAAARYFDRAAGLSTRPHFSYGSYLYVLALYEECEKMV